MFYLWGRWCFMSKTNDIKSVIERMIQNGVIPMDESDYDRCMFTGDLLDDIQRVQKGIASNEFAVPN